MMRAVFHRRLDEIAEQIKEGVIDPEIGMGDIYQEVLYPLGKPSDLKHSSSLLDDWCWNPYYAGYSREKHWVSGISRG